MKALEYGDITCIVETIKERFGQISSQIALNFLSSLQSNGWAEYDGWKHFKKISIGSQLDKTFNCSF